MIVVADVQVNVPPQNLVDDLLCKVCKKARNGQNWAFAHLIIDEDDNTRTLHSGNCMLQRAQMKSFLTNLAFSVEYQFKKS